MSKANAKIPPVKITPVMKFNPNEDTLSGSRSSSSMDKSMNDFNVPKRQKTSIHRKHASVLKMTRAEYAAFKEKYSNEDGKLDSYILSKAAKNLNKIIGGNEVHSISGDEAVLKLAERVNTRQEDRSGYCRCFYFILVISVYLVMLGLQTGDKGFEQYSSLQRAINDGNPITQDFYLWLGGKLLAPVFVDPPCGDGECQNLGNDHPKVGRFGCATDCGEFKLSTDLLFNITGEFSSVNSRKGGYNICPRGAMDTSRCVFPEYMKGTKTSLSISKGMWGSQSAYSFYEHNFSTPFIDGDYVIRIEAAEAGIGVLATYNYTRYVLGYQLSHAKQLLCKAILDPAGGGPSPSPGPSPEPGPGPSPGPGSSGRRLPSVGTVFSDSGTSLRSWQVPSNFTNDLPCLTANNATNPECRNYCINNIDSCREFKTKRGIVLSYPTLAKACVEYNILAGRRIAATCTLETLNSGFQALDLRVKLQAIEKQIEDNTRKAADIIAENMENTAGYFHKFSLTKLESQLRLLGCTTGILPLTKDDVKMFLYPDVYNMSTVATRTVLDKPRCLDVSQICKKKNGEWDFVKERCVCAPNKYGNKCDKDCPVDANGRECNGNGVCSSVKKMCKCNAGYDPATNCLSAFKCTEDANCGGVQASEAPSATCGGNADKFPDAYGMCSTNQDCINKNAPQYDFDDTQHAQNMENLYGAGHQSLCDNYECKNCYPGWGGRNCEYAGGYPIAMCSSAVASGAAVDCGGFCLCKGNYWQKTCSSINPSGSSSSTSSSNSQGTCTTSTGVCQCSSEYEGVRCSFPKCSDENCVACEFDTDCSATSECGWEPISKTCMPGMQGGSTSNNQQQGNAGTPPTTSTRPPGNQGTQGSQGQTPPTGSNNQGTNSNNSNNSPSSGGGGSNPPPPTNSAQAPGDQGPQGGQGQPQPMTTTEAFAGGNPGNNNQTAQPTATMYPQQGNNQAPTEPTTLAPSGGQPGNNNQTTQPTATMPPQQGNNQAPPTGGGKKRRRLSECSQGVCSACQAPLACRSAGSCTWVDALQECRTSATAGVGTASNDNYDPSPGADEATDDKAIYSTCSSRPDLSRTFGNYIEYNFTVNNFPSYSKAKKTPYPPEDSALDRFFGRNNIIIGGILIDQTRYKVDDCTVEEETIFGPLASDVVEKRKQLYSKKCLGGVEKTPYGSDGVFVTGSSIYDNSVATSPRFKQQLYPEISKGDATREKAVNVGGVPYAFHSDDQGRYPVFFDINNNAKRAAKLLEYMKTGHYIDFQTNQVNVQFMTYNGNTGVFGLVNVTFTYQEDGKLDIEEKVRIIDVETYNATPQVTFRFCLEVLFTFFMLIELLTEVGELISAQVYRGSFLLYFQSFWNYIDLVSIVMQFVVMIMWWDLNISQLFAFAPPKRQEIYQSLTSNARYLYTGDNMTSYATSPGLENLRAEMATLDSMASTRETVRSLNVICIILQVIRLLKLLDFQPKLGLVTRTIAKAKNDLFHFVLIFLLINLIYALCGWVIFGETCESFSQFDYAVETVLLLFTQANVETIHYEMKETSMKDVWGYYFYSFTVINVFIMLNILLAILVDAYVEVRADAQYSPGVLEELLSIGQTIVQNKKKSMSDKELSRAFKQMAWSNHRQRVAKVGTGNNDNESKGRCGKCCEAKKTMALPLSVVDTLTNETILRVPVVKSSGDQLIEYHIDEAFIDGLLREHLNAIAKPGEEEKTFQRMKSAILSRYAKEMTVQDAHNDQEHDILTDDILELEQIFKNTKNV
jgi:hypothetical protein